MRIYINFSNILTTPLRFVVSGTLFSSMTPVYFGRDRRLRLYVQNLSRGDLSFALSDIKLIDTKWSEQLGFGEGALERRQEFGGEEFCDGSANESTADSSDDGQAGLLRNTMCLSVGHVVAFGPIPFTKTTNFVKRPEQEFVAEEIAMVIED